MEALPRPDRATGGMTVDLMDDMVARAPDAVARVSNHQASIGGVTPRGGACAMTIRNRPFRATRQPACTLSSDRRG